MVVIRYNIIIIKWESNNCYKEYNRCIIVYGYATSYFVGSTKKEPKFGKMSLCSFAWKKCEDFNQPQWAILDVV